MAEAPDVQHFTRKLEQLGARLRQEIRDTLLRINADRYGTLAGQVHDTKDQAVVRMLTETGEADIARDAAELADVESAMARLRTGTYGTCTACATRIPDARLEAYPTAKRCRPCQERREQRGA